MAAFGAANPKDKAAFLAHRRKIIADPDCLFCTVEWNQTPIGTVGSFWFDGERDLGYGIAKEYWGKGLTTQAVQALLSIEPIRPLGARVAVHNAASIRILEKCGFQRIGSDKGFSDFLNREVEEHIYSLR
jgi:RimJ/RimL family protein N-acetyltransferase